jgi:hypothetical protein
MEKLFHAMSEVIIYTEDPGAANYILNLPKKLALIGIDSLILADGSSREYLKQRNIDYVDVSQYSAISIIDKYSPKLILIGTSENKKSLGLELISQANVNDIVTVGYIDMLVNADVRFKGESDNAMKYAPDWLFVPDDVTKVKYIEIGFDENKIKICGHPHYDRVKNYLEDWNAGEIMDNNAHLDDIEGDKKIIVFISESRDELNPSASIYNDNYSLRGRGNSDFRTHIVLEELLDAIKHISPKPYLIVRLHPKNKIEEFSDYINEVDEFNQDGNPLALLMKSDLVVGMTSMLLMESAILGAPSLCLLPIADEANWLPNTANGYTDVITDKKKIMMKIEAVFKNKKHQIKNKELDMLFISGAISKIAKNVEHIMNLNT